MLLKVCNFTLVYFDITGSVSPQTTSLCCSLRLLKDLDYIHRRIKQIGQLKQVVWCFYFVDTSIDLFSMFMQIYAIQIG